MQGTREGSETSDKGCWRKAAFDVVFVIMTIGSKAVSRVNKAFCYNHDEKKGHDHDSKVHRRTTEYNGQVYTYHSVYADAGTDGKDG